jgi:hypothetical protein
MSDSVGEILDKSSSDQSLIDEIKRKVTSLGTETSIRQSDFLLYKDYYMGRQEINRGFGRSFVVTNVCSRIVNTYTHLLAGSPFDIEVKKKKKVTGPKKEGEEEDPQFKSRDQETEMVEELLYQWKSENKLHKKFVDLSSSQSLLGEADFYLQGWDSGKGMPVMRKLNPYFSYRSFVDDEYDGIDWSCYMYDLAYEQAVAAFGEEVGTSDGSQVTPPNETPEGQKHPRRGVTVIHYAQSIVYDEDGDTKRPGMEVVIVNEKLQSKRDFRSNSEFPFFIVPNRTIVNEPSGIPDLRDIIGLQDEYNVVRSSTSDIIRYNSAPYKKVWGRIDMKKITNEPNLAIHLGRNKRDGGDIETVQNLTNLFPVQRYISEIEDSISRISGLPKDIFQQYQSAVTFNAQFQPTLNSIEAKRRSWEVAFSKLFLAVLHYYKRYGGMDWLNPEEYDFRIVWPNMLRKDDVNFVTTVINKFKNGLISMKRAMEDLGIQSPTDEMTRIAFERNNPLLNPQQQQPEQQQGEGGQQPGELDQIDKKLLQNETIGSQEEKARQENEELQDNRPVNAQPDDDHELHLTVHAMLDPGIPAVADHIKQHQELMKGSTPEQGSAPIEDFPYQSGESPSELVPGGQPADTRESTITAG